ncbi:Ig-like domain-containing protein [Dolosigranulum savutiense]|uniref:Ig-like domain-containing protein n=1 Tax=Dolosigranulum savutiense TaxID=3110288 RepID=A0AB74U627_9LACT
MDKIKQLTVNLLLIFTLLFVHIPVTATEMVEFYVKQPVEATELIEGKGLPEQPVQLTINKGTAEEVLVRETTDDNGRFTFKYLSPLTTEDKLLIEQGLNKLQVNVLTEEEAVQAPERVRLVGEFNTEGLVEDTEENMGSTADSETDQTVEEAPVEESEENTTEDSTDGEQTQEGTSEADAEGTAAEENATEGDSEEEPENEEDPESEDTEDEAIEDGEEESAETDSLMPRSRKSRAAGDEGDPIPNQIRGNTANVSNVNGFLQAMGNRQVEVVNLNANITLNANQSKDPRLRNITTSTGQKVIDGQGRYSLIMNTNGAESINIASGQTMIVQNIPNMYRESNNSWRVGFNGLFSLNRGAVLNVANSTYNSGGLGTRGNRQIYHLADGDAATIRFFGTVTINNHSRIVDSPRAVEVKAVEITPGARLQVNGAGIFFQDMQDGGPGYTGIHVQSGGSLNMNLWTNVFGMYFDGKSHNPKIQVDSGAAFNMYADSSIRSLIQIGGHVVVRFIINQPESVVLQQNQGNNMYMYDGEIGRDAKNPTTGIRFYLSNVTLTRTGNLQGGLRTFTTTPQHTPANPGTFTTTILNENGRRTYYSGLFDKQLSKLEFTTAITSTVVEVNDILDYHKTITGKATAGSTVTVTDGNMSKTGQTDAQGNFTIRLDRPFNGGTELTFTAQKDGTRPIGSLSKTVIKTTLAIESVGKMNFGTHPFSMTNKTYKLEEPLTVNVRDSHPSNLPERNWWVTAQVTETFKTRDNKKLDDILFYNNGRGDTSLARGAVEVFNKDEATYNQATGVSSKTWKKGNNNFVVKVNPLLKGATTNKEYKATVKWTLVNGPR